VRLMTLWNAYRQASVDIRTLLREEEKLIDTAQYRSARFVNDKMLKRLRQQAKFNKAITRRVKAYDNLSAIPLVFELRSYFEKCSV